MEEYASKILVTKKQICSKKKWSFKLLQGLDTLPGFLSWGIKKNKKYSDGNSLVGDIGYVLKLWLFLQLQWRETGLV